MESDQYPLHESAKHQDDNLIRQLLKNGVDVNQRDKEGRTPLHYAILSPQSKPPAAYDGTEVDDSSVPMSPLHQSIVLSPYTRYFSHNRAPTPKDTSYRQIESQSRYSTATHRLTSPFKRPKVMTSPTKDSDELFEDPAIEAMPPSRMEVGLTSDDEPLLRRKKYHSSGELSPSADKRRNKLGYHRTSVACGHCRRRKIRCLIEESDPQGRCKNCIRLKKGCNFFPVDQNYNSQASQTNLAREGATAVYETSATSSPRYPSSATGDNIVGFRTPLFGGSSSQAATPRFGMQSDLEIDPRQSPSATESDKGSTYPPPTRRSDLTNCVSSLLRNGTNIDANIQDNNGRTPLHLAAQSDSSRCLDSLLEDSTNIDANIQDNDGRTPLHLAVQSRSKRCISSLLRHTNTNANIQDHNGCTPLHLAARLDSAQCFDQLLDHPINTLSYIAVSIQDKYGYTPYQAIEFPVYKHDVIRLLERGADPSNIKRWWHSREESRTEKEEPEYLSVWEKAANGVDYENIDELMKDMRIAQAKSDFSSLVWEWEIPAVLALSDPTEGEARWLDPEQQVVLVNSNSNTDYMEKPANCIQATTFAGYLKRYWNEWWTFILELLDLVKIADLNSENSGFSVRVRAGAQISVTCYRSNVVITFGRKGLMEEVHLLKALDWVCKAMRIPKVEDSPTLSTTTYRLERCAMTEITKGSLPGFPHWRRIPDFLVVACIDLKISALPHSDYNCWQQLFQSCTVSDSALLSYRGGFGKGLETPFDLMISLAAVEYSLIVDDGVVFIGYQTVLIPTAIQGNCAQFHLITSNNGQINPYLLDLGERMLTTDPSQFKTMRCFLGWCEAAQVNLGTRRLPATVKYSGGCKHGESLQLDGYAILAQAGASAPLSAVLGLQTNFKYASHRRQFTPHSNYCKLLHDTSRELAIVYDAAQRRSWLVPKLSLLLHMSHAYNLASSGIPDNRVPYVEPHADAIEVISVLEPLGDTIICGQNTDEFLFRELMLGLNTNLLKTVASIRKSSGKSLYGFEFMDVVTEPGRGACMKKLEILSPGKDWLKIVNAVDAVVVCSDLGEAITALEGNGSRSTNCGMLPRNLDYLAATLPCLDRLARREGRELITGNQHIKIAENTLWEFTGDPFGECQHSQINETCWERSRLVQLLVSERYFGFKVPARPVKPSPLNRIPVSGAVVFGKRAP